MPSPPLEQSKCHLSRFQRGAVGVNVTVKEEDIIYEADEGRVWVWRDVKGARYVVFVAGLVVSESDSAYLLDPDGLSIAQTRADYLARSNGDPHPRMALARP